MLSATMKIVRLSSYRRLCRSADENLFQEFVRKRNQKNNKQSQRSDSTSLPNLCYGHAALIYLKAPQWQEGCAGLIQYKSVLMGRSRNSSRVPELTTTFRTSFPEDHRVEESSSLRNYHPGFATGVVIPANLQSIGARVFESERLYSAVWATGV